MNENLYTVKKFSVEFIGIINVELTTNVFIQLTEITYIDSIKNFYCNNNSLC